jgi:hypothetical protein
MKAISLWQPWASAIALGSKRVETRSWGTKYRGPIAIHAAKRLKINELIHYHSCWNWQGAMHGLDWTWGKDERVPFNLPLGAIVATAHLTDCRHSETFTVGELETPRIGPKGESYRWTEGQMGDFGLGRFGWVLADIRPLAEPVPFKGAQGFFNVPDELLA